ncbi:MAG: hypothetical protein RR068_17440, partial [Hafnia sp.]
KSASVFILIRYALAVDAIAFSECYSGRNERMAQCSFLLMTCLFLQTTVEIEMYLASFIALYLVWRGLVNVNR